MNDSGSIRLLVIDDIPTPGGIETFTFCLLPELARYCEKVIWLVPHYRKIQLTTRIGENKHIYILSHQKYWLLKILRRLARLSKYIMPSAASAVEASARQCELKKIAHENNISHIFYPALFNQSFPNIDLPIFATIHDTYFLPNWRDECLHNIKKWTTLANRLITISRYTQDSVTHLLGHAPENLCVIPLAAPEGELLVSTHTNRIKSSPSEYHIFMPATFAQHKNHIVLLKALFSLFEKGYDFRVLVSGHDTHRIKGVDALIDNNLELTRQFFISRPRAFRDCFSIFGHVSNHQLIDLYQKSDIVILPSSMEGFGLPLLEAIAAGKPVVCSNIPAFQEQVETYDIPRAIHFIEPGSSEALSRKILECFHQQSGFAYSEPEVRLRLSRWTWRDVAHRYFQVFSHCEK